MALLYAKLVQAGKSPLAPYFEIIKVLSENIRSESNKSTTMNTMRPQNDGNRAKKRLGIIDQQGENTYLRSRQNVPLLVALLPM